MLRAARRDGVDVVYGVRSDRSTDSVFKRTTARMFYSFIRRISSTTAQSDAGDFRLMSRATVEAINSLPDTNRVLRFVVPALGFVGDGHPIDARAGRGHVEVPVPPDAHPVRRLGDRLLPFPAAPRDLSPG